VHWLDVRSVVTHDVVVQLNAARLLGLDHDVADLEEDAINLRVVVIESLGAIDSARALVGLQDD
jgi:hypothetical protein